MRALARRTRPADRSSSTTTRTWPRSRSSRTAPRRVLDNFLLVTLGTGVGGGIVIGGHGVARRARLRRRDRSLPGRPERPDVRVRGARPLGGAGVRAPRSGAGPRRAPPRARRRRCSRVRTATSTRSPACCRRRRAGGRRRRARDRPRVRAAGRGRAGRAGQHPRSRGRRSISGGLVELGGVLLDPLREWFAGHLEGARYRPPVDIVPAWLGEEAGRGRAPACWRAPSTP